MQIDAASKVIVSVHMCLFGSSLCHVCHRLLISKKIVFWECQDFLRNTKNAGNLFFHGGGNFAKYVATEKNAFHLWYCFRSSFFARWRSVCLVFSLFGCLVLASSVIDSRIFFVSAQILSVSKKNRDALLPSLSLTKKTLLGWMKELLFFRSYTC